MQGNASVPFFFSPNNEYIIEIRFNNLITAANPSVDHYLFELHSLHLNYLGIMKMKEKQTYNRKVTIKSNSL